MFLVFSLNLCRLQIIPKRRWYVSNSSVRKPHNLCHSNIFSCGTKSFFCDSEKSWFLKRFKTVSGCEKVKRCIFVLLGELYFLGERTAVVFLLSLFEALCHWCTTAQPLLHVALSPPCFCLRGGFWSADVRVYFYACFLVDHTDVYTRCVARCPTLSTFLIKIYFSSTSLHFVRGTFVNFQFIFFLKKRICHVVFALLPPSNKAVRFRPAAWLRISRWRLLQSLKWRGHMTTVIFTSCRRQLTLVTDKSASETKPGCLCLCWVGLFAESSWLLDPCGSHAGPAGSQAERQGGVCQHSCSLRGSVIDTMWATDLLHRQLPLFCCCGQK